MQKLPPTAHNKLSLPLPSEDALVASRQLQQLIHREMQSQNGIIAFARYMELALYAPKLGYYSGGAVKLGIQGDFTTAPEMTSLFGATIAQVAHSLFLQTSPCLMEFGAGTGRLAFDILSECQRAGVSVERYFIVELSGELRVRQETLLKDFPQVIWLEQMPASFSGIVLGNEVLDAMPIHLVMKVDEGWVELGVSVAQFTSELERCTNAETQSKNNNGDTVELTLSHLPRDAAYMTQLIAQIPDANALPVGYITEVHPVAQGFIASVSDMLLAGRAATGLGGAALFFDYGFPAREYYVEQRAQGSLMCHYRHHAHPDPFYLPGLQDITAHVDFTAMAQAALDADLDLLAYTSQAGFLLDAGITEILQRIPVEDVKRYLPAANAMQKLISPAEMGELFKVLVVGCGVDLPDNLMRHDRRYRL